MKKIILLLLLALYINISHAQTGNPDSIKLLLQNDIEDTSRVLHLADLSFEYLESKPDTTMVLALEALTLANRIDFEKGKAISLNRVGNAYSYLGDYPKAMEVWLEALKINEKINNLAGKQANLNNISIVYREQEDYRQALYYLFQAKSLGEQLGNKRGLSLALVNIGTNYDSLKVYDSAMLYALQGYDVAYKINYNKAIGNSLLELGHIHFVRGQNNSALEYYHLSILYSKKAKNDITLIRTFLDIAKLFEKLQKKDSALFYARQSLYVAKEKGFTKQVLNAGRFLSSYFRNMRIQDSAYFYQDITKAANDSLFSQQKSRQFQTLVFDEKLRQADIEAAELKDKKKRNHNLQYAAIALGLLTFIILFLLLSHSIIANQKLIRFLGVIALLIVFEFINLFIHPYLSHATNDSPLIMLLVMVCIAALLVPLHHRMEKWISHRLVEKNKKIRLEAAKKTIAKLEGDKIN